MVSSRSILLATACATTCVFVNARGNFVRPLELMRRDDNVTEGTNLYNCHDNCGEAILEEEVDGFCNNTIFTQDYAACLQCAGPDNEDIWQYYGSYLTAGAAECGSPTVPLTGTQANVSTALAAQNASTTATTTIASQGGSGTATTKAAATLTSGHATASSPTATGKTSGAIGGQVILSWVTISSIGMLAIVSASMMV